MEGININLSSGNGTLLNLQRATAFKKNLPREKTTINSDATK